MSPPLFCDPLAPWSETSGCPKSCCTLTARPSKPTSILWSMPTMNTAQELRHLAGILASSSHCFKETWEFRRQILGPAPGLLTRRIWAGWGMWLRGGVCICFSSQPRDLISSPVNLRPTKPDYFLFNYERSSPERLVLKSLWRLFLERKILFSGHGKRNQKNWFHLLIWIIYSLTILYV